MPEVIDISSSSDEDEGVDHESKPDLAPSALSREKQNGSKAPPTSNTTETNDNSKPAVLSPEEILETRRRKIDQLLEVYLRYHERLHSVENLMNPVQKQTWTNHLENIRGPPEAQTFSRRTQVSPELIDGVQGRRPPWFIDPPGEVSRPRPRITQRAPRAPTAPKRKKKVTKKRKPKVIKSRATTSRTTTGNQSRTPARRPAASSTYSTGVRAPMTSARKTSVRVESQASKARKEPTVKAKKEPTVKANKGPTVRVKKESSVSVKKEPSFRVKSER